MPSIPRASSFHVGQPLMLREAIGDYPRGTPVKVAALAADSACLPARDHARDRAHLLAVRCPCILGTGPGCCLNREPHRPASGPRSN